jgi:tetratricopeptide (TPR) repeat protein
MRHHVTRRLTLLLPVAAALIGSPALAQDDPRKLFEAGQFQQVIEKTPDDASAEALFVKALAQRKLDQNDQAKETFGRLGSGGEAWGSVGESARALVDGNLDGALEAAKRATAQNGDLAEAHYQLGLVLDARGQPAESANAFARAAEIQPQMAYAQYMAGMAFYKAKRVDKMAVYFENFLKLAPNAPERPAVQSIMKTIRGR